MNQTKMSTEGFPPIQLLPVEVLANIFSLVTLSDKRNCRLTCHAWRFVLDHPSIQQSRLHFRALVTNDSIDPFLKSFRTFDQIFVQNLTVPLQSMTSSRNNFPRIQCATIGANIIGLNILKFLQYGCPEIVELGIDRWAFANVGVHEMSHLMPAIAFANLAKLNITISLYEPTAKSIKDKVKHFKTLAAFLRRANTPKVTSFGCTFITSYPEELDLRVNLFVEYFTYLSRHTDSLRHVKLTELACKANGNVNEFAVFIGDENLVISEDVIPLTVRETLEKHLKLESYNIFTSSKPGRFMFLPCLGGERLKELKCGFMGRWREDDFIRLTNVVTRNSLTLNSFMIFTDQVIDLTILKDLNSLVSLDITAMRISADYIRFPNIKELGLFFFDKGVNPYPWIIHSFPNIETFFWGKSITMYTMDISIPEFQNLWVLLPKLKEFIYKVKVENEQMDHLKEFCENTTHFKYEESLDKSNCFLRVIRKA